MNRTRQRQRGAQINQKFPPECGHRRPGWPRYVAIRRCLTLDYLVNLLYPSYGRDEKFMRRNCLRYARCLACLALVLLPFHPVFGQSSPAITNVTMVGSPSLTFPPLAPGSTAVIL